MENFFYSQGYYQDFMDCVFVYELIVILENVIYEIIFIYDVQYMLGEKLVRFRMVISVDN